MSERRRARARRWIAVLLAGACAAAMAISLLGPAGSVAANRAGVKIRDFSYHPKTLKVAKGTKVAFTNRDRAKHTATDKGVFNTGKLRRGEKAVIAFKHKGTFRFICTIHPFMHGKIVVG
jgi:plastocyanin